MINTERNGNGGAINGTGSPAQDKQLQGAIKKTALRDVQNENMLSIQKQQKSCEAIKVSGAKRLTPERPLSSQLLPSLSHSGANENVMNARRRFELEFGKGKLQNKIENYSDSSHLKKIYQSRQEIPKMANQARDRNVHQTPVVTSNNMTPTMAFSSSGPSIPSSFGKQNVSTEATKVHVKDISDQLRAERHGHLQKFLTQCDEANQKEYLQMLLRLSPADLSKHAWELEKRAINLALEEGQEMKRKISLNILAKPYPSNNLLQSSKS